jgi:hypothetical protein
LIQDELEYDSSHLATFFIANHNWQRKQEIPLLKMDDTSKEKTITMDQAVLSSFVKDAHQKLIYLFDFINDRCYYLELMETKPEAVNRYYPICTDFAGEIPPQFGKKSTKKLRIFDDEDAEVDIFSSKKAAAPILDDDFEEDFAGESFEKDMNFEIDDDALIAGEEEEEEPEDDDKPEDDDDLDPEDDD